jgi:hypothetical protein
MTSITVTWTPVEESLPDAEMTVLMAIDNGETWTGYCDGHEWYDITGMPMDCSAPGARVTHWMDYPPAPRGIEA